MLKNLSCSPFEWHAAFHGKKDEIKINGKPHTPQHKTGAASKPISFAAITVKPNEE